MAGHAFAPVNPPEWIANLRPQMALMSISAGEWDAQPSPETLAALEGNTLLLTVHNAWIHLSTDRERKSVEEERN